MSTSDCYPSWETRAEDSSRKFVGSEVAEAEQIRCPVCAGDVPLGSSTPSDGAVCPNCRCSVSFIENNDPCVVKVCMPRRLQFQETSNELFQKPLPNGDAPHMLIVDVSTVSPFSAVLGSLSSANKRIKQSHGQLKLIATPHSQPRQILDMLGLHKVFDICDDEGQALKAG
jgi:anti-anti-sigma regulatory factor